ncbi:hypothetical protein Tco_0500577 [Tanacetum coccineum]
MFDRLDLEELYNLVMQRFESTTPEGVDLVLWGDLRTMFDANAEDIFGRIKRNGFLGVGISMRIMGEGSLSVGFITTNGHQFTMSNRHQELASPEQTSSGKDLSNSLMADSLPKTIWFSSHHASHALCYCNEALTIPEQTATGKEISNPFMAGSFPKTTKPTYLGVTVPRDMKITVNSAQLLQEFKSIGNGSNFGNDLKRSNIMRVKLSSFAKTYHSFPWRYFQHDLISNLKLKGFPSYVGIALLTIMGSLDAALDLNNLLSCLVDDLLASELTVPNFSPANQ